MAARKLEGAAQALQIFIGDDDLWENEPLHRALIHRLRLAGAAGVTVTRGMAGFGLSGQIRAADRLGGATDLPVVVTVIDMPERIVELLPIVDELVRDGLVIRFNVEILRHQDDN
ncbi:MAG: DUF190 domain-containing protein [Chloracidobacterium sp.]|uniref:DUF190 domain-containing protein n=1 Tax=Chloracidobacterium validum TaxID=2821543 RepID=A0ABX8BI04_9BACT|nr:DUF190 domain-containing protein [Chloracidobacterium validum]QUW04680.1 DUF190 domain-containing protein [Chloracidobacterium validum]